MTIETYKKCVIRRRCNGNERLGKLLAKAIEWYEKSKVTNDWLAKYYRELRELEK
jgi:hypothetical protein